MPRIQPEQDEVTLIEDLSDPNVELDLTSDPWNLVDKQASMIVGRDVIHIGRLAPDGGRKPVGSALPDDDQPAVEAFGSDSNSRNLVRYRDLYKGGTWGQYTGTAKKLQKLTAPYAWPAKIVGAYL